MSNVQYYEEVLRAFGALACLIDVSGARCTLSMPPFTPTRSLLNPQFEGYKLSFTPAPHLQHISLPQRATQSRTGIDSRGFQEVASRVRHNHLAVGGGSAMYVAEDGSVVLVRLDERQSDINELDGVSLRVVFQLPESVSHSTRFHAEYPAAVCLSEDMWLVSDGHGIAFLINIPDKQSPAGVLASWELLVNNEAVPSPFQLHTATIVTRHLAIAILSSPAPSPSEPSSSKAKEQPMFDIWAVLVPLSGTSASSPAPFEVKWHRRGTQIPIFVKHDLWRDVTLLIGGSSYFDIASQPVQPYDPAPDELVPIPRAGDINDTPPVTSPLPYSWTQTDDTVTVAFALPGTTPKTSINAMFERGRLSISAGSPPLSQPLYDGALLWDIIHPTSSLWTWERGTVTSAGLLTVHLDKAHPGTRWSHVFAQGFEVHEVPETLDPSELATIRETLDKYTASLQENARNLGDGVPSLAEGERDNEVDSSVGHSVLLTWVAHDGSTYGPADDSPAVLLSLPLPGANDTLSLVMKNDIDGPLYILNDEELVWKHVATYPALGFVLASKRDTRFTFHLSSSAVLAFDSGARNGGGGNVYIYRRCMPGDKWAKQGVFQQQTGVGALLGVGSVSSQKGQQVLLCLSERELTVCSGVL